MTDQTSESPDIEEQSERAELPELAERPERPERVVAIIPCKNCEDSIESVVNVLLHDHNIDEVIVVDDGSKDDSALKAAVAGAKVVVLPRNVGKGDAVAAGVKAAPNADIYLLVDADTGDSASGALPLLLPIRHGDADLVVGILPSANGRGGFGSVKKLSAWGIKRIASYESEAPLSGQRAVRGTLLRSMVLQTGFGLEVGMTIDAIARNARVLEMHVNMEHHHHGKTVGGFVHRGRQGWQIAKVLWPRLVSTRVRIALFATLTILAILICGLISDTQGDAKGNLLAKTDNVRVALVSAASWSDQSKISPQGNGASVVTGDVKNVFNAVQAGSRDKAAEPNPDVRVDVVLKEPVPQPGEVIIVAGITTAKNEPEMRPITILGLDVNGTLTSPSTHRSGLVDLTDIAPTVLYMKGKSVPSSMTGDLIRIETGNFDPADLEKTASNASFYQDLLPKVTSVYAGLMLLIFLYAGLVSRKDRDIPLSLYLGLTVAAFPLATYLTQLVLGSTEISTWGWSATCALAIGMIVVMSSRAARSPLVALRRLLVVTMVFIAGDLLTGANLQSAGIFGSSPILGHRYSGIGNPATAVLLFASVIWATLHVQVSKERPMAAARIGAVFALLAAVVGAPGLGSDVGGLIAFALVGTLMVLAFTVRKITWQSLVMGGAVALSGVAIGGALDYLRAAEDRTHLGRLFARVVDEGFAPLWDVVSRKVDNNITGYLFPWNLLLVALAVFFLVVLIRSTRWSKTLPVGSVERIGAVMALAASLVLYVFNDSGVVVIALVAVFLGPYLLVEHKLHRFVAHELEVGS